MSYPNSNTVESRTTFTWTIKNFDMCTHQTSESVKSPEFSYFGRKMEKFYLLLYPRGIDTASADYLTVLVAKSSSNETHCETVYTCKTGIVKASGKQSVFSFVDSIKQGYGHGLPKFLDRKNLSSTDKDLTLYCSISDEVSADRPQTTSPDAELLELSETLSKAYEEGLLTDMALQTKGETLKVHRSMIEARFPGLLKMNDSGLVNIEGKTADALLRYIYTGTLKKSDLQLLDLEVSPDIVYHMRSLLGVKRREIKSETILSRECVSFRWEVKQFRTLTSNDVLSYLVPDSDIHSWTWLKFSLTVSSNESSDIDGVLFSVTRHSRECKRIICRISALDICKTFDHTFGDEDCWNIQTFAHRGQVVDRDSDDASFLFEVSLTDGKSTSCVNSVELSTYSTSSVDTVNDLELFRDDLGTMLKHLSHQDVELITFSNGHRNEHRIPCHQFVLAARSRVFRKMFETEKPLNQVPITDVEPEVVESMLRYLYTARINEFPQMKQTLDLYELANRYDIPGMKKECVRSIKSLLSVDTLGEVLVAADKWSDADLKESVFDFMCTFPRPVLESSWLKEVLGPRSHLALEILSKALSCLAEGNNNRHLKLTNRLGMEEKSRTLILLEKEEAVFPVARYISVSRETTL